MENFRFSPQVCFHSVQFNSVQSLSSVWLFATPWIIAGQASLSITNSRSSLKHVHRVSDAIQPSHPLSKLPLLILSEFFKCYSFLLHCRNCLGHRDLIYTPIQKKISGMHHFISNWQWIGAKFSLIQLHLSFLDAFIGIRPINTSRSWLEACELDDIQFAINSQAQRSSQ